MKRLMPDSLRAFLRANRNMEKADCFVITLPTGAVIHATEGQFDITFPSGTPGWSGLSTTFKARDFGVWQRGDITSEATTSCKSNTMALTCRTQKATPYPGLPISLNSAAFNHLLDGCKVWIYTAYFLPGFYGDVSQGIETKWQGTILKAPSLGKKVLEFECADPGFLLNQKVPSRLLQSNCGWGFCDSNCKLTAADYTVSFTAATGSTQNGLVPTALFTQPDGYFVQGVVTCLTGDNAGLSQAVRASVTGLLVPVMPWLLPVAPGDTFSVIKGCDKTLAMCKTVRKPGGAVVDNSLNFPSNPFSPAPSEAV